MLDPLYGKFNKAFFAGFAERVAGGAEAGDRLCMDVLDKVSTRVLGYWGVVLGCGTRVWSGVWY